MGCNALQVASLWTVPSDRRWQFGSRVGENGMNCGLSKRYPLHRIYGFPLTRRTHVIVKGSVLIPMDWERLDEVGMMGQSGVKYCLDDDLGKMVLKRKEQMWVTNAEATVTGEDDGSRGVRRLTMSAVRCWRRRNVIEARQGGGPMGTVFKVVKRVLRADAESLTKVSCDMTKLQAQEVVDATVGVEAWPSMVACGTLANTSNSLLRRGPASACQSAKGPPSTMAFFAAMPAEGSG
ncbi:unnamed protein product [Taenia asiatica]|uniref:Protein kinase domain-containing protein n=1 Tax=Taenia asiatica TaxID=60517 RepID=A0A0R3VXG5_TAEAS|nr:unnamed protein product [Taenia asiatica]